MSDHGIGQCTRCGKCCQIFIPAGFAWGPEWEAYYHVHGYEVEFRAGKPFCLKIPTTCPHLKKELDVFEPHGEIDTGRMKCDIYDHRPELCRHDHKGINFYRPEGCTR